MNTIQRLDGSTISPGIEGPQDIAIDVAQNKMYWTDKWTSTIRRANLDGTQVEDMLTGVEEPEDIALDLDAGRMYWTEWGANAIRRADLDGENAETLVEVEGPQSIALDVTGNKMYWTAQEASFFSDGGVIQRANLNGENAETLLTGLNASEGIALDLVEGKMYWVHRRTEILRANLDGSSLESLVSSRAEALVLDVVSGKMYWTNKKGGSIHRADLDGENVEEIVSGLVRPVGIALDVPPPATTPDMADITQTPNPDPCSNGLVVPNPLQNPSLVEDCRALLAFRNSWNRDYVRHMHWDAASRISYWTGIEVHDSRVKYISISEYSLHFEPRPRISGPLSPELGQLTELESLSLPLQGLTGLIPPELGQLTKLKVLNFYHNKLTGPIPPELSQLTELKSLDLGDNQLTGPIPPELGQLTNLTWLGLYRNKLTGPIPPELSQLTELKSLDLGDNQLTGSIPPELGQLTKLWYLRLDGNLLTGPIPSELSQLTNLERLYLNNNSLTGPIPSELSQLTNLQELDLHDNQFTCVPEALSKWADDLPICTNATDPTDWVATPDFDSDGQVGFADFFLFADHFGSSDARFDLDDSGVTDFADFFLFADHFDPPARAKLVVLAQELIGLPDNPQLQQNAPNPFNSQTVLSYFLHASGPARLEVFSLTGQRVAVLRQGPQQAGYHRLHWDGRDAAGHPAASGMYLYRLVTDEGTLTRKLMLLR
ncbi:MAG: leucine-rich repeat domain-containing protein [Candidatus Latescibacteria bacterium]|nr:leucine-rich repeat domain-containing protein [Candidatus Latescibacterota bacterium]